MLQISEIVKKTEEMFDLFNEHFYNKELTRPAITVSPDGGRGAYGWCSINEIWNANEEKYREINLCAEYLDRPMTELAATLLHEMAHLYDLEHDIQDVSNNGYYHNMKFKVTAEAHGLIIEKHQKYGWTVTKLAPEAEEWIKATLGEAGIKTSRQGGSKSGHGNARRHSRTGRNGTGNHPGSPGNDNGAGNGRGYRHRERSGRRIHSRSQRAYRGSSTRRGIRHNGNQLQCNRPRRKELATAIGEFIGMAPVYMKAPTYGFAISNYILDKNGTLRGEENKALVESLAAKGFTAA